MVNHTKKAKRATQQHAKLYAATEGDILSWRPYESNATQRHSRPHITVITKDNRGNAAVILGLIGTIIVIVIVALTVTWNAMKSTATDVTNFMPSLGTIFWTTVGAGVIIAVIVAILLLTHQH